MQPSQTRELATFDAYTAVVNAAPDLWNRDAVQIAKQTVCSNLDDREFLTFMMIAARTRLDVFSKQIYAIKRGDKLTIQTGIDGYIAIAERTGELAGIDEIEYDEENDGTYPKWARAVVWRARGNGPAARFAYTARWREYVQMYNGKPSGMWDKMPFTMLGKCALARALRLGFPAQLSGVYTKEELDQAQDDMPAPDRSFTPSQARTIEAAVSRNVTPIRPVASRTAETVDQMVAMTTAPAATQEEPADKPVTIKDVFTVAKERGFDGPTWANFQTAYKKNIPAMWAAIRSTPIRMSPDDTTGFYPPEDSADQFITPDMVASKERHAQEDDAQTALDAFNGEFESVEGEQTQSPDMLATAAWSALQRRMAALNMSVGTQDDFILQMTGKASDATLTPEDYHTLDAALAVYEQEHAAKSGSNDLRKLNTGRGNKGRS